MKDEKKEKKEFKVEQLKLNILLEELSRRGFISTREELMIDKTHNFGRRLKPFKIGIVSDTHIGSNCQQITLLHEAYNIMNKQGVKKVFHAGDMIEGNGKLFRGQIYEMFLHGADSMINYTIRNYPKIKGMTTYVIGGSHDYSFYRDEGTDVLDAISKQRDDLKYIGMFGAFVKFGKISIYVMHGSGGVAYARSYKMQKIIEQIPPEKKPHILLLGHYHVQCHLPTYRNVAGFQLPCFQTQTNYLMAKGLFPEVGFLILRITPSVKGIFKYDTEWYPFYVPVKNDY